MHKKGNECYDCVTQLNCPDKHHKSSCIGSVMESITVIDWDCLGFMGSIVHKMTCDTPRVMNLLMTRAWDLSALVCGIFSSCSSCCILVHIQNSNIFLK